MELSWIPFKMAQVISALFLSFFYDLMPKVVEVFIEIKYALNILSTGGMYTHFTSKALISNTQKDMTQSNKKSETLSHRPVNSVPSRSQQKAQQFQPCTRVYKNNNSVNVHVCVCVCVCVLNSFEGNASKHYIYIYILSWRTVVDS